MFLQREQLLLRLLIRKSNFHSTLDAFLDQLPSQSVYQIVVFAVRNVPDLETSRVALHSCPPRTNQLYLLLFAQTNNLDLCVQVIDAVNHVVHSWSQNILGVVYSHIALDGLDLHVGENTVHVGLQAVHL